MNAVTACPICYSHGVVHLTDVVNAKLVHDSVFVCPLCQGLGTLKKPARRIFAC